MTLRTVLVAASVAAAIWLAYSLERIILVLLLAMFLAYVIGPLVEGEQTAVLFRGHSRRLPRAAAIAVVYLLLAGSIAAGAALLWPAAAEQVDAAIANGPRYAESIRVWERGWVRAYERIRIPPELRRSIDQSVAGAGAVAVVAVALAALHAPLLALWTAVFLTVLRIVQDYVIYPRLIGRDIELHPLVVILAVLAGLELGGVAGIFLAVPIVALITVAARHWLDWRSVDADLVAVAAAASAATPASHPRSGLRP